MFNQELWTRADCLQEEFCIEIIKCHDKLLASKDEAESGIVIGKDFNIPETLGVCDVSLQNLL